MAGFADIDSSTPLGSTAPNTIHTIFQTLKANILAGMSLSSGASCVHNGQAVGEEDMQGQLLFEVRSSSDPTRDTPTGYIYIRQKAQAGSGDTQSSRLRRKTSTGWTNVGLWLRQRLGLNIAEEGTYASEWQTVSVNTKVHSKTEILTASMGSDSPRFFLVDADYDGANSPNIVFSACDDPQETNGTATAQTDGNIYIWVSKSTTDSKYYLNIYNDTANNENVEVCVNELQFN